ncbi:MAG: RNA 2',3'-cyclic phosphodiesterase [Fimbriimonadales bacterium]|nr:RNA 2',3'-cyclic phosphodiesterase [Fimbriimonadales bacterium]
MGSIRAFVAIYPSEEERRRLAAFQDVLRRQWPEARWVRGDQLHLTLRFVGELPEALLEGFRRALREEAARTEPFDVRLVHRAPPWRGARVVAVSAESRPLVALAQGVEAAARAIGLAPEDRRFRGHVTLARVEGPFPPAVLERAFEDRWRVRSCRLMRSDLRPSGATHTLLEEFPFGG